MNSSDRVVTSEREEEEVQEGEEAFNVFKFTSE